MRTDVLMIRTGCSKARYCVRSRKARMGERAGEIELYLSQGLCCGNSFAQTAHDHSLLFSLTRPSPFPCSASERLLLDAHSAPLLHAKRKGLSLKKRIDVYKYNSSAGSSLAFTIKASSLFSNTLHIFMAGSTLDGAPDYKLKPSTFTNSMKIFRHKHVVAKANQGFALCGCFEPDYKITIVPGMDQAMVVLLVAIRDDLRPKSSGGG